MKLRDTVTITYGGDKTITFEIQQLNPTKANKMLVRTVKMIGEPMFLMFAGMKKDVKDVLPDIARLIREGLDENEVDSLIKEFMECAFINGQPVKPQFETVFMGKLPVVYKLLIEILKLNYADFLSEFVSGKSQEAQTNQA
jgi:hypothetical protein